MTHPARRSRLSARVSRALRPSLAPAAASLILIGLTTGAAVAFAPVPERSDRATAAPAPDRTSPPTPTPTSPASLDLPPEPWWGGPAYYAKFSKAKAAGWTSDTFFPIAVFYGKPSQAPLLASIGINTYMGAEHDGSSMASITKTGISVIAQSEWTPEEVGDDPRVVGWHASDECDMGSGDCPSEDEYARLRSQQGYVGKLRSLADGRFIQANFGNGVLGTYWARETMSQQVSLVDVSSVDKYAYTSPAVRGIVAASPYWLRGVDPQSSRTYGWLQDRMAGFSTPNASKPNWVFVETAEPYLTEDGARSITTDEISGAVWNAIIHGAAGISYFQHNSSGCGNYSLVQCAPSLRDAVQRINAKVQSLAPVINTRSYRWNFGPGLDTTLKVKDGAAYVFAMSTGTPGARDFTLPPGARGTRAEVVGENRTIPITNGRFSDSFDAEYSSHVYRIPLRD